MAPSMSLSNTTRASVASSARSSPFPWIVNGGYFELAPAGMAIDIEMYEFDDTKVDSQEPVVYPGLRARLIVTFGRKGKPTSCVMAGRVLAVDVVGMKCQARVRHDRDDRWQHTKAQLTEMEGQWFATLQFERGLWRLKALERLNSQTLVGMTSIAIPELSQGGLTLQGGGQHKYAVLAFSKELRKALPEAYFHRLKEEKIADLRCNRARSFLALGMFSAAKLDLQRAEKICNQNGRAGEEEQEGEDQEGREETMCKLRMMQGQLAEALDDTLGAISHYQYVTSKGPGTAAADEAQAGLARVQKRPVVYRLFTMEIRIRKVWRRVRVHGNTTLAELSKIMKQVMGWSGYHLHAWSTPGLSAEDPFEDSPKESAHLVKDFAEEGSVFGFTYDLGDSWVHTIAVEKVDTCVCPVSGAPGTEVMLPPPVCLGGAKACPCEDGIRPPGYNPDAFDLAAVNERLARIGARA